jgi:hypothetical protein
MKSEEEKYADEMMMRYGRFLRPDQVQDFVNRGIPPEHAIGMIRSEEESKKKLRSLI